MFPRTLATKISTLATHYRVVTLLGPRQSGKTTLVKSLFPQKAYFTLENIDTRELALTDPRRFLADIPEEGCVLDEIQKAPELLSYIQGIVDEHPIKGRFILTGSHQPRLQNAVAQSLAGRTSLSTLYPLTFSEMPGERSNVFEQCYTGFFPGLHQDSLPAGDFYQYYIKTYMERDLKDLIHVRELRHFQQFLRLLAGRVGQPINYSSLANDVGASDKTIKEWISVLEASFLVFVLPPYYRNFGKRLIKAPKLYFTDTGLLCYLLGIRSADQVERDPLRGSIFENLIIAEIAKSFAHAGEDIPLYFYRDKNGVEVDLLFEVGRTVHLVELKSAQTYTRKMLTGLLSVSALFDDMPTHSWLVYNGKEKGRPQGIQLIDASSLDAVRLMLTT